MDDLIHQVEELANEKSFPEEKDLAELEENGPRTRNPSYIFCPAPHQLSILRLFAKHHSLHPLLPE